MSSKLSEADYRAAIERGRQDDGEPRASAARYDRTSGRVMVELVNGCMFAFPARQAEGLAEATHEQLEQVTVTPSGHALHWDAIDASHAVPSLMRGVFGSKAWTHAAPAPQGVSAAASTLGSSTSEAKTAAARANGAKGGRPRKSAAS